MALTHLKSQHDNNLFTACFRRIQSFGHTRRSLWVLSNESFIEGYTKSHGKDFCSKCAKVLIDKGLLVAAENTITDDYRQLIEKLRNATKHLHDAYITATKTYAKSSFAYMQKIAKWNEVQWCEYFGLTPRLANYRGAEPVVYDPKRKLQGSEFWSMPTSFYNSKDYGRKDRMENEARRWVKAGYTEYEADEVKHAENHYSDCISKLAARIEEKSLNTKKMKITSGKVGANGIDTIITDGTNTVHAWTIIAEGPIKRPHYRYLVK